MKKNLMAYHDVEGPATERSVIVNERDQRRCDKFFGRPVTPVPRTPEAFLTL